MVLSDTGNAGCVLRNKNALGCVAERDFDSIFFEEG